MLTQTKTFTRQTFNPVSYTHLIAQDSESHHVAAAGADPLDKASDEEVAAGMRLGAEPVSYTHLDVYKRQQLTICPFELFILSRNNQLPLTEF